MKFHKLPHFTRDVTGQHYRPVLSRLSPETKREEAAAAIRATCIIAHKITDQCCQ